jgi:hypothetical protein
MNFKDACKQKLEAELAVWNARIDMPDAIAESAGAVMRGSDASLFHANQPAASEAMADSDKDNGATWGEVKESADKIWDDLKAGFAASH